MKRMTRKELQHGLTLLGVAKGDHIIVHSALNSLGRIKGGASAVLDALLEAVGVKGTVIVPTFGSEDEAFDPAESETSLGALPSELWKRSEAVRSRHPMASVAAIGAKAQWLVKDHEKARMAHGKNTPYTRLADIGGKILLLGVDQDRSTCLHTAEELAKLPYLRTRKAKYLDTNGKTTESVSLFFPGPHRDFIGLQPWLEQKELVRKTLIGSCVAQLMVAGDVVKALGKRLESEPDLFISKNPNLPDALWQRADVFRGRLAKEAFTLAADSQYAGTFMEEIVDNTQRYGIGHLVLSYVNGKSWHTIPDSKRRWYLQALKHAKIKVSALRLAVVPSDVAALLAQAGTKNLIVPASCPADTVQSLASCGIDVKLENIAVNSAQMETILSKSEAATGERALAFNPLNFATVDENPFLHCYSQTRLRRHIGVLFINDGLATGERTDLKEGLAEINELVSILRCASFAGLMVLQGPGCSRFRQTAETFLTMLKELGDVPKGD